MQFDIITIFPKILDSYINETILKRAQEKGVIKINVHNLRDYTDDKHSTVDDVPYGGGAGMVLKIEPLAKAIQDVKSKSSHKNIKTILLAAKGKKYNQAKAQELTKVDQIILICGRYEGVDERISNFIDEEISIGEYVLSGGEIPALVVTESISRLLPGVLGNEESIESESHSQEGILEYPQYTRPEKFKDLKVPDVLLSGNHKEIEKWRQEHQEKLDK